MTLPSTSSFTSIIDYKRALNLDVGSIIEYFSSVLASDGKLDRGALRNGNLLFKDHFLQNIAVSRRFIELTITAKCRAQMKKATIYQLKLVINSNRPADILQGACECVAGNGPRAACKHLAALCFALLDCLQHDKTQQQKPNYLQFLNNYTYVPGATDCLHQLLVKYKQHSSVAASFLFVQETSPSFIPLPARIVAQDLSLSQDLTDPAVIKYYYEKVHLSLHQVTALEQTTRGQSSSERWHEARRMRISDGIRSTAFPCGLVVDATAPYLCCSPDALIIENDNDLISYGILECKCVYTEPGATWDDLISIRENFCLEQHANNHRLRRRHPYFYQMIALLNILDLSWIDICVLKGDDIYIERLTNDQEVWATIKKKLTTFYFTFLLPEIMKNVS
ncbi:unnamed protein product [Rotaria socialis]|uniref:SWIM-type domain-containing protein n=2 Tax=Rotaria socialis TaxID=392032 RepID=A0A821FB41_9BILA|nr:unnamed protein product [Rotaria socialis]CAF4648796.1 unnamed protein product [Rotaria socialis]